jgi:hypothetical protein
MNELPIEYFFVKARVQIGKFLNDDVIMEGFGISNV